MQCDDLCHVTRCAWCMKLWFLCESLSQAQEEEWLPEPNEHSRMGQVTLARMEASLQRVTPVTAMHGGILREY